MKTFIPFALIFAFVSCGPAPELKLRPLTSTSKEKLLDNKSPQDVLKIKYDNKVVLNCSLKAQLGANVDLTEVKAESFSWNLVNASENSKTITYSLGERILEVEVAAKIVVYGNYKTPVLNGVHYVLSHTPIVEVTIKPIDTNIPADALPLVEIAENTPATSFLNIFDETVSKSLECSVATEINSRFADEWEKKVEQTTVTPAEVSESTETQPAPETT